MFFYPLLVMSLIACDPAPENRTALRIGTNVWPGYEPLYLARHLGYLEGQNIRLVEYSSASQVIRSYRNDLIDAAAMTLDEALLLLDQGYHPKVVLVMDVSDGADVIIGKPDIREFKDLINKKVGVENTALGAFFLARALEKHGMTVRFQPVDATSIL
ncbi:MAG: ABC transporter substrate-binding protein [Gammaproteobacteria bacterium]|nr:ABC transporter substrate-binding protein [Gammaproteobacteria bacterium]